VTSSRSCSEDTDAHGAEHAGSRRGSQCHLLVAGKEAKIHASIGIAVTGPHAGTTEELIRNADIAMYAAKSDEHRRSALYEHSLHSRLREKGRLALELEHAVERAELVAHYQPIVSLVDGTIQAFEALVRWPHPERGLLSPSQFITLAEESGLMIDVGRCVLEQAFRSAQAWQDVIPDAAEIGISVNLSPSELTNERLVRKNSHSPSPAQRGRPPRHSRNHGVELSATKCGAVSIGACGDSACRSRSTSEPPMLSRSRSCRSTSSRSPRRSSIIRWRRNRHTNVVSVLGLPAHLA
jgi:hypothetical protein